MMTDPIADMLTRIRNGNAIQRKRVSMPASRMKVGVAEILKEEGFLAGYEVEAGKPGSTLHCDLKYGSDGQRVIRHMERVSKPGCRIYRGANELPVVLRGLGIFVLSTPKGILSDRRARAENVGGEVLAKIY